MGLSSTNPQLKGQDLDRKWPPHPQTHARPWHSVLSPWQAELVFRACQMYLVLKVFTHIPSNGTETAVKCPISVYSLSLDRGTAQSKGSYLNSIGQRK